jgi:hypothetical protein
MKTNPKAVLCVLAMVAAACGVKQTNSVQREEAAAECSLSLAPHSDAQAIQRAIQAVADGSLDPCAGGLAQRQLYRAVLARVDQSDGPDPFVVLVYRMTLLHPGQPKPQIP